MDSTTKQLNIKVVSEGLDETIAKVKELGNTVHDLSSKKTTKSVSVSESKQEAKIAKQTSTNLKKSASSLSKILISLISIRKLSNFFRESLDESSSWIENLNLFEVAMGNATQQGLRFTKTMSEAFGLDQNQLIEYMGLFNQMAQAIGNSTEIAYKMSEALTALGLDISSLYNISVDTAMSKLRSGIAGQVKPVRELGLDITAQSLDKYLKEDLGLDMTSKMLSQSQKQLLRTIMLIQQTNNAWGDLSKTINSFSNQQKVMASQISQLKRAFGDLLIGTTEQAGIATKALYYINGALMALVEIVRVFIPEATSSGFNKLNNDLEKTKDNTKELTDTLDNSLLSFDKFNALNSKDSKGSDWLSSLLEEGFLEEYEEYMRKFEQSMNNIKNKAVEIKNAIMSWLGFEPEFDAITSGGKDAIEEINWKLKDGITNLDLIITGFNTLIGLSLVKYITNLTNKFIMFVNSTNAAGKSLINLNAISQGVMLFGLYSLFKGIEDGNKSLKIFGSLITAAGLALFTYQKIMEIARLETTLLTTAIKLQKIAWSLLSLSISAVVVGGLLYYLDNMNKLSSTSRIAIGILLTLAGAFTTVAIAAAAMNASISWATAVPAILAGVAAATGGVYSIISGAKSKIQGFANGGYPETGQMFIANEKGPELVGNIGGRTAVANNDMIVKAIEQASYRGIVAGLSANGGTKGEIDFRGTNTNYLAKALAEPMVVALRQLGYKVNKA